MYYRSPFVLPTETIPSFRQSRTVQAVDGRANEWIIEAPMYIDGDNTDSTPSDTLSTIKDWLGVGQQVTSLATAILKPPTAPQTGGTYSSGSPQPPKKGLTTLEIIGISAGALILVGVVISIARH